MEVITAEQMKRLVPTSHRIKPTGRVATVAGAEYRELIEYVPVHEVPKPRSLSVAIKERRKRKSELKLTAPSPPTESTPDNNTPSVSVPEPPGLTEKIMQHRKRFNID